MFARIRIIIGVLIALIAYGLAYAGNNDEWTHYGGGQDGLQYSSLSQITPENVDRLEEAWRFRTGELGQGHRGD